jgi:hypothetical protein
LFNGRFCLQLDSDHVESHAAHSSRQSQEKGGDPEISKDTSMTQPEHHHNAAEEGETANIKQNTTNKGLFPRPAARLTEAR